MSEHPKLGMYYDLAKKKLRGPLGKDPQIRESILNQVKLHEGEGGRRELVKELASKSCTTSLSGAGNRQVGGGDGYKLGDGRYRYEKGTWVKIK